MKAEKTLAAINAKLEGGQERDHRNHLGASIIGRDCARQIWYGFRWASKEEFEGKQLRLFDRGNEFEPRAVEWLQGAGMTVWEVDESQPINPKTGKHPQFRVSDCNGHFGGSLDGILYGCPDLPPGTYSLGEFKTHNDKSFTKLKKEGICQAKPEHFAQCQIYMFKMGLPWALYLAINKNDDHIHTELIQQNPNFAATLVDRARVIVETDFPAGRVGGRLMGPGFFVCRFCSFSAICHDKVKPEVNCRTCRFSVPIDGGQWKCSRYGVILTEANQRAGCNDWDIHEGFLT